MPATMKAVRIHQYGPPSVLVYEDAPCPTPGADEVLVRVHAVGINPVDWKTRAGSGMGGRWKDPFPLILGWDLSGVVESVGAQAQQFKPGDEVFGMVRFPDIGSAYAEYVAAPAHHLALKPRNIDHLQAAAVPLAALTAWQAFFEAGNLSSGQRVLIQAAAGGVGHLAVQIAKWKGAHVIGTSSTANLDFLRTLGADESVDYTTTRFEEVVAPVDMVLNAVRGDTLNRSFAVLKPGGTLVSIAGAPDAQEAQKHQVKASSILVHPDASHLTQIAELIAAGHLKPIVTQVFALAEMQKAHESGEASNSRRGKIVLNVQT